MSSLFHHHGVTILPDASRTIARPFVPDYPEGFDTGTRSRAAAIVDNILALDDAQIETELAEVSRLLDGRHRNTEAQSLQRFESLTLQLVMPHAIDRPRRLLIGSYFTQEYSFEAAALFNPQRHASSRPARGGGGCRPLPDVASRDRRRACLVAELPDRILVPGGELRIKPAGPTTRPPDVGYDAVGDPGLIKLLASTPRPILSPAPEQRHGYVPNVVYSCGALAVGRDLLLPCAVADSLFAFAATSIDALLRQMT